MRLPPLPRFTLPAFVGRLVSALPQRPPALLLCAALDFGVGRIVPPDAVAPLAGRRFTLVVRDLGLRVGFAGTDDGFRPSGRDEPSDFTIAANLRDYIALALREEDPDTLFFARRLAVEGDTELGLIVKNLLDGIDWSAVLATLPLPLPLPRAAPRPGERS